MVNILVINGPNLNMLGKRQPNIYGKTTLADINQRLIELTPSGSSIEIIQSNSESEIVSMVQNANSKYNFLILNPAAFGHTSIALRDALLCLEIPFIEVHLSNIFTREDFRKKSYTMDLAMGIISGLGANGYYLALQAALNHLEV